MACECFNFWELIVSRCRTFDGFRVLVEKDWLFAGHPFQWRCGHGFDSATRHDNEMSPIFFQFLDCMHQLVKLYPHYFEYGPRYLLTIADNLFNCRFGTFLGLCESDRVSPEQKNNNILS